jgi:hypothetical protein
MQPYKKQSKINSIREGWLIVLYRNPNQKKAALLSSISWQAFSLPPVIVANNSFEAVASALSLRASKFNFFIIFVFLWQSY